jgi:hypothetical protein
MIRGLDKNSNLWYTTLTALVKHPGELYIVTLNKEFFMTKKSIMKAAAVAVLFFGITAAASADMHINGGFSMGFLDPSLKTTGFANEDAKGKLGVGGHFVAEYVFGFGLSVGGEIGVVSAKMETKVGNETYKDTITAIPILARVGYHFGFVPDDQDFYIVGKIGYVPGMWSGKAKDTYKEIGIDMDNPDGAGFGFDVGWAYYFTSHVGLFLEGGFDYYYMKSEYGWSYGSYKRTTTLESFMSKFFTVGVGFKF